MESLPKHKYELIILFEGYCKDIEQGVLANCTCTLLKSSTNNIIIDTRTPWDGDAMVKVLQEHNLTPDDINYCICSHGHSDHIGCNYLFKNALQIMGKNCISRKDHYYGHDFQKPYVIDEHVQLVATVGHSGEDISLLFESEQGLVAIVGDLFEKEEDLEDDSIWKSCSEFPEMQEQSRHEILKIADYIVPGHGPMFKNPRKK